MNSISKTYQHSLRDRGSKFLGYLFSCESEEEFGKKLDELKAKFPDASHHCYAWRINPNKIKEFSSDDGEPSGTAGLPILNQLKSFEMVNAGLVIVRYFGGTKLGKSGLIDAYGSLAKMCLSSAELKSITPVQIFEVKYNYPEETVINKLRETYNLIEQDAVYLENVTLTFACPAENSSAFEKKLESLQHLSITFKKKDLSHI